MQRDTTSELSVNHVGDYLLIRFRCSDTNTSINAQYKVHSGRNGGIDFQYDAVVRNKEERRHLEAGDCECCRDVSSRQYSIWESTIASSSTMKQLAPFLPNYGTQFGGPLPVARVL